MKAHVYGNVCIMTSLKIAPPKMARPLHHCESHTCKYKRYQLGAELGYEMLGHPPNLITRKEKAYLLLYKKLAMFILFSK